MTVSDQSERARACVCTHFRSLSVPVHNHTNLGKILKHGRLRLAGLLRHVVERVHGACGRSVGVAFRIDRKCVCWFFACRGSLSRTNHREPGNGLPNDIDLTLCDRSKFSMCDNSCHCQSNRIDPERRIMGTSIGRWFDNLRRQATDSA